MKCETQLTELVVHAAQRHEELEGSSGGPDRRKVLATHLDPRLDGDDELSELSAIDQGAGEGLGVATSRHGADQAVDGEPASG